MLPDLGSFVAPGEAPPFSDQTLVDVRAGRATVLTVDHGVAVVRDGELELVVAQEARGRGIGTRPWCRRHSRWAAGPLPGSRGRTGTTRQRVRWPTGSAGARSARCCSSGRRSPSPMSDADVELPDGYSLSAFRPGTDDETDWLALNAAAFAPPPRAGVG